MATINSRGRPRFHGARWWVSSSGGGSSAEVLRSHWRVAGANFRGVFWPHPGEWRQGAEPAETPGSGTTRVFSLEAEKHDI